MAHALARGGRAAGDECHDRLLHVRLDELRRVALIAPADLADENDCIGFDVGVEHRQQFDVVQPLHRIAADAHACGLADLPGAALPHRFVSQCPAARDDAHLLPRPGFAGGQMNVAGHDADLAFAGRDDARAVGADKHRRVGGGKRAVGWVGIATADRPLPPAHAFEVRLHLHHVQHRNAFSDRDDGLDSRIGGFHDRVGGEGWGDEDHRRIRARRLNRLPNRVEDRQAIGIFLTTLARGDPADHFGAVFQTPLGMKRARRAGDALADDLGAFVD